MSNTSGQAYGFSALCPIQNGPEQGPSHADQIRTVLADFNTGPASPLAKVHRTHMARLSIIDDVYFQGAPAQEDHLRSKYLFFNTNFDGDLDSYLEFMLKEIPADIDRVWTHCVGFPGVQNAEAFRTYFRRCQIDSAIFFCDYPESAVADVLRALKTQREFIEFVTENQGKDAAALKAAFDLFRNARLNPI